MENNKNMTIEFLEWVGDMQWSKNTFGEKEGLWSCPTDESGLTTLELYYNWIDNYINLQVAQTKYDENKAKGITEDGKNYLIMIQDILK